MEKQLKAITKESVLEKAARNEALTLKELAVLTGYGYSLVRSWQNQGLPVLSGRVFPDDFVIWRRGRSGLQSGSDNGAHRLSLGVGKSGESLSRHD